ncbi:MAG: RNA polymerase sigma factor [Acidimicrobiia bacterium]
MQDSADPVRLRATTFEAFYASAWEGVYRPVVIVLGDPGLAAEAVDEAMTRAFERWSSVSRMENPEGWVYRVAVNWARSWLRRIGRQRTLHGDTPSAEHPVFEPGLAPALRRLSPEHREVVVLRYLQDWSEAEIATALGLRPGTVKSRLHRAMAQLRQEMT